MSCLLAGRLGGVLDGAPLFMCKGCGAYASAKCVSIKQRCPQVWGGRKHGYNRFLSGKHPCLPKVLVEGCRAVVPDDFAVGIFSCMQHECFDGASVGGIRQAPPQVRRVPPPSRPQAPWEVPLGPGPLSQAANGPFDFSQGSEVPPGGLVHVSPGSQGEVACPKVGQARHPGTGLLVDEVHPNRFQPGLEGYEEFGRPPDPVEDGDLGPGCLDEWFGIGGLD